MPNSTSKLKTVFFHFSLSLSTLFLFSGEIESLARCDQRAELFKIGKRRSFFRFVFSFFGARKLNSVTIKTFKVTNEQEHSSLFGGFERPEI